MPISFLQTCSLVILTLCLTLSCLRAFQQNINSFRTLQPDESQKCVTDMDCFFGGTCSEIITPGVCSCPTNFRGILCQIVDQSVCGEENGKYPELQKESPTVQPVTCKECDSSCKNCSGPSPQDCTECDAKSAKKLLQNFQCVASCSSAYYQTGNTCQRCDKTCDTCSGPEPQHCIKCDPDSMHKLFVAGLNQCHIICPKGYYEAANNQCLKCHQTCSECVSQNQAECFNCPSNRFLYDHKCETSCPIGTTAEKGECASNCPSGEFTTSDGADDCQDCSPGCSSCSGPGSNQCITCAGDKYLVLDAANGNTCVTTCPSGMWADSASQICRNCPPNCAECSKNGTVCNSCESPYKLLYLTCVAKCGSPYYVEQGGDTCLQCHFTCKTCSAERTCTSCYSDSQLPNWPYHLLYNGQCIDSCPKGYYSVDSHCNVCPQDLEKITKSPQILETIRNDCKSD